MRLLLPELLARLEVVVEVANRFVERLALAARGGELGFRLRRARSGCAPFTQRAGEHPGGGHRSGDHEAERDLFAAAGARRQQAQLELHLLAGGDLEGLEVKIGEVVGAQRAAPVQALREGREPAGVDHEDREDGRACRERAREESRRVLDGELVAELDPRFARGHGAQHREAPLRMRRELEPRRVAAEAELRRTLRQRDVEQRRLDRPEHVRVARDLQHVRLGHVEGGVVEREDRAHLLDRDRAFRHARGRQ